MLTETGVKSGAPHPFNSGGNYLVQAPPHLPPHSHRADNAPTSTLTVFESPISESFKSTAHNSDVEDIETDTTHQVSLPESSPEQSYDLERDSSPHRKVYHRNTQHPHPKETD